MTVETRNRKLWHHPDSLFLVVHLFAGSCGQSQLGDETPSTMMDPTMAMTSPSAGQPATTMTGGSPTPMTGGAVPSGGMPSAMGGIAAMGGQGTMMPAPGGQVMVGGQPAIAGVPTQPDVIDESAVIQSIHAHVIVPTFNRFEDSVADLKARVDAFATQPSDESLQAV
jgi:hypothetical protein